MSRGFLFGVGLFFLGGMVAIFAIGYSQGQPAMVMIDAPQQTSAPATPVPSTVNIATDAARPTTTKRAPDTVPVVSVAKVTTSTRVTTAPPAPTTTPQSMIPVVVQETTTTTTEPVTTSPQATN